MLAHGVDGDVAAVPLVSRIHEGLVFSNRDTRTLLDKLSALLCSIARLWQYEGQSQSKSKSESKGEGKVVLVADAYYGSGRFIHQLLAQFHQLVGSTQESEKVAILRHFLKNEWEALHCATWTRAIGQESWAGPGTRYTGMNAMKGRKI